MAYMSQERKQAIAAEVKKVMPAGWKYSLAVRHHSTLVLTIQQAPVNILATLAKSGYRTGTETYWQLNTYHLEASFADPAMVETFKAIHRAMNGGNHDRSDIQSDYFDVGWYTSINIGRYDRPFVVTGAVPHPRYQEGVPA